MPSPTPRVESFVVRFVQDTPGDGAPTSACDWYGTIVHVQTNQEYSFTRLADAVAFMARYVSIGTFVFQQEEDRS